ncbi:hypothetical protein FC756_03165 [Lysinibacillus mangiferihumi]|uniref:Uncharacterized protein n=1 Tax=Lysinibacillus mangiferihumi TaxID=1130819 RepID=A0A4U2ZDY9_9BACI|nr:hypothetical protein [Lysinibacillus mangiferihumi]TKI72022.1 hypothetical protein FC756_03165 [Lysinibacillus mangiferihumi]
MPEINLPTQAVQAQIKAKVDNIDNTTKDIQTKVTTMNNTLPTIGKKLRSRVYTVNGTFVVPAGVTEVYLTGGGGGGGAGGPSSSYGSGTSGGVTSFGTLKSMSGGRGGDVAGSNPNQGGGAGGPGGGVGGGGSNITVAMISGDGGNSGPYTGGKGSCYESSNTPGMYCSGGGAPRAGDVRYAPAGGGGAEFIYDFPVTVTPGATVNVTIGGPGRCPFGGNGDGGSGILTVKWWE